MRSRVVAWCQRRPATAKSAYCVTCGAAATVAGAAASLLAHGSVPKIIVWIAVTAVVSVAAGCVYPVG